MNFIFNPSLQHIAVVKIATTLLIQEDISDIVRDPFIRDSKIRMKKCNEVERKLNEKVKILLPELLSMKILGAIKPIIDEILLWKHYHITFLTRFCTPIFKKNYHKLCWTSHGTVDRKKTAEVWIRGEELDTFTKYVLACMYCLENYIKTLYDHLPYGDKKYLCDKYVMTNGISKIVVHWTARFKEASTKLGSECAGYRYALQGAADEGNSVATMYFFEKLSPEQENQYLLKTITEHAIECYISYYSRNKMKSDFKAYYAETSCILLSAMDEEQQMQVFGDCPRFVLDILLQWPNQSFVCETVKVMWDFLSPDDFCYILFGNILHKVLTRYKDYDYLEVLMEFWQKSPVTHKTYAFDENNGYNVLFYLSGIKDKKKIQLILKDATYEEKSKLICGANGQYTCRRLIKTKEWDILELLIRECISSKDRLTELKAELKDSATCGFKNLNAVEENELDRIFRLARSDIQNNDKMKSVEAEDD